MEKCLLNWIISKRRRRKPFPTFISSWNMFNWSTFSWYKKSAANPRAIAFRMDPLEHTFHLGPLLTASCLLPSLTKDLSPPQYNPCEYEASIRSLCNCYATRLFLSSPSISRRFPCKTRKSSFEWERLRKTSTWRWLPLNREWINMNLVPRLAHFSFFPR